MGQAKAGRAKAGRAKAGREKAGRENQDESFGVNSSRWGQLKSFRNLFAALKASSIMVALGFP